VGGVVKKGFLNQFLFLFPPKGFQILGTFNINFFLGGLGSLGKFIFGSHKIGAWGAGNFGKPFIK